MQTADICDFFVSVNIKKQVNLWLPFNIQKLEVFQLQGSLPLTPFPTPAPRTELLSFAYCSINMVLPYDIMYHF